MRSVWGQSRRFEYNVSRPFDPKDRTRRRRPEPALYRISLAPTCRKQRAGTPASSRRPGRDMSRRRSRRSGRRQSDRSGGSWTATRPSRSHRPNSRERVNPESALGGVSRAARGSVNAQTAERRRRGAKTVGHPRVIDNRAKQLPRDGDISLIGCSAALAVHLPTGIEHDGPRRRVRIKQPHGRNGVSLLAGGDGRSVHEARPGIRWQRLVGAREQLLDLGKT